MWPPLLHPIPRGQTLCAAAHSSTRVRAPAAPQHSIAALSLPFLLTGSVFHFRGHQAQQKPCQLIEAECHEAAKHLPQINYHRYAVALPAEHPPATFVAPIF